MIKESEKILIGGKALLGYGSSRSTKDVDYLIFDSSNSEAFITGENVDYLNGAANKFFGEIYKIEAGNKTASPQSLLELKVYAWIQHFQNGNFQKADDCEYDIKFLVRKFNLQGLKIVKKHIAGFEFNEAMKIINIVKGELR